MTDEIRKTLCPQCSGLLYLVGHFGGDDWGYIKDSGPVNPDASTEIKCPHCETELEAVSVGNNLFKWVEKA